MLTLGDSTHGVIHKANLGEAAAVNDIATWLSVFKRSVSAWTLQFPLNVF